eukprot:160935_1
MRELGNTQIILEKKIKNKNKLFIEKGLKRFISSFFKELGCYKIILGANNDIIYIYTHKSPDDNKLNRFSLAIKEALDLELQQQQIQQSSYIYVLKNFKIKYKINSDEL